MDKLIRSKRQTQLVPVVPPRHRSRAFKVKSIRGAPATQNTGSPAFGPGPQVRAPERASYGLRRFGVFVTTMSLTAAFTWEFYSVLSLGGITAAQIAMVVLFALNLFFVSLAAVTALCGLAVNVLGLASSPAAVAAVPVDQKGRRKPPKGRTAILFATYNEEPDRVFGSAVAMMESLVANNAADAFDIFILSDTTDPEIWVREEQAFAQARARLNGGARLFYRRRLKNIDRKTGNLWQWLWRWGPDYDYMLILDADSLMSGETMVRLAVTMDQNDDLALLQTVPVSRGRQSLFARMQQFASSAFGPLLATGLSFWHGNESNFWGHNAILRTRAFMGCAQLPVLKGNPPLGGAILSHDFVEAAFLRRAGWRVAMAPELGGSFEESPPSLIDFAQRDRRWCQGNLQHARVLPMAKLHWISRVHLITGIMAYVSAVLWLTFLSVGLYLVWQSYTSAPNYFPDEFSLFPNWPRQDSERAITLFAITMLVVLLPKILSLGWILTSKKRRSGFGGGRKVTLSVVAETLISTLLAPIFMLLQSKAVFEVLTGRDSGWQPQHRDDGSVNWSDVLWFHRYHMIIGATLGGCLLWVSPMVALWMSPAILGLACAGPLSALTADPALGRSGQKMGLFVTPAEAKPDAVAQRADVTIQSFHQSGDGVPALVQLRRDPALMRLHVELLGIHRPRQTRHLNEALVLALARLDHARSLEDLDRSLSRAEKLAFLGDRNALAAFADKFATSHARPRRIRGTSVRPSSTGTTGNAA